MQISPSVCLCLSYLTKSPSNPTSHCGTKDGNAPVIPRARCMGKQLDTVAGLRVLLTIPHVDSLGVPPFQMRTLMLEG